MRVGVRVRPSGRILNGPTSSEAPVGDGGASGATVEPEDERSGLGRGLDEPVEEGPAGPRVDGGVAGVLGEGRVGRLAKELRDPVPLLIAAAMRWRRREEEEEEQC